MESPRRRGEEKIGENGRDLFARSGAWRDSMRLSTTSLADQRYPSAAAQSAIARTSFCRAGDDGSALNDA